MPDTCWQHELFKKESIFTMLFVLLLHFSTGPPRYLHMMPQVGTTDQHYIQSTLKLPKAKYNLESTLVAVVKTASQKQAVLIMPT
jgi:hypothetical protein